jgi:hypothetical protein
MVPNFRRIALAAALFCTVPVLAQDNLPRPIPSFEATSVRRSEPEVTYADGKLRIVAHSVTLGEILDSVRIRSGAVISAPTAIAAQPVSLKVGPGALLDVITDLLDIADCNYIVVGSAARPSTLKVVVTAKPSEAELTTFARQAEANLSLPENSPDPSIVTLPETVNEAESTTSPKEPGAPVTAAENAQDATDTKPVPDAKDPKTQATPAPK